MAQAQHGAAPDIADKNIANPISLILSSAMLLDWLGKNRENRQINFSFQFNQRLSVRIT